MGPILATWIITDIYDGRFHLSGNVCTNSGSCTHIPLTEIQAPMPNNNAIISTCQTLAQLSIFEEAEIISTAFVGGFLWNNGVSILMRLCDSIVGSFSNWGFNYATHASYVGKCWHLIVLRTDDWVANFKRLSETMWTSVRKSTLVH